MAKLLNRSTGQYEEIANKDAVAALQSGRYGADRGQRFNIVGPEGEKYTVPVENLEESLGHGFRVATEEEIRHHEIEQKYGDDDLAAFAAGVGRGLTFGASDWALTRSGLVDKETLAGLKEANPTASVAGEVTATVGSLVIPGGAALAGAKGVKGASAVASATKATGILPRILAKGAGAADDAVGLALRGTNAGLGRQILSKGAGMAVGGAIEGAAYGAGQLVSEAALGDPDEVAERALGHIGTSALLGGAASLAGGALARFGAAATRKAVQSGVAAAKRSGAIGDDAAAGIMQRVGKPKAPSTPGSEVVDDVIDDIGRWADDAAEPSNRLTGIADEATWDALGLTGAQRAKLVERLGEGRANSVASRLRRLTTPDGKPVIGALDNAEAIAPKLRAAIDDAGKTIGKTYASMDDALSAGRLPAESVPSAERVAQGLDDYVRSRYARDPSDMGARARKAADRIRKRLVDPETGGFSSFDDAQKQRMAFQQSWRKGMQSTPGPADIERKVERLIKQELETAIDSAPDDLLEEGWKATWRDANDTYAALRAVSDASSKRAIQLAGNRGLSLTDNLAMFGGMAGRMASGGSPVEGGATGLVLGLIHNQVRERGNAALATVASKAAKLRVLRSMSDSVDGTIESVARRVAGLDARHGDLRLRRTFAPAALSLVSYGPLAEPTGDDYLDRLRELTQIQTNPNDAINRMAQRIVAVSDAAPETATAMAAKASQAASYLYEKMPKPPPPGGLFDTDKDWRPSDAERQVARNYIGAVENPMGALLDAVDGKLSPEGAEVLRDLYPGIVSALQKRVTETFAETGRKPSYQQLAGLTLLYNQPASGEFTLGYFAPMMGLDPQQAKQSTGRGPDGLRLSGLDSVERSDYKISEGERLAREME